MDKGKDPRSIVTIKFNDYVKIDEKQPFVLYLISVMTRFSKIKITKRYSCFKALSVELRAYSQNEIFLLDGRKEILCNILPRFPDSSLYYWNLEEEFIEGRKHELEQYSQSLVDLFCKQAILCHKQQETARELFKASAAKSKFPFL
jgi:hypothetical protein